jgi:hypothetical protein
LWAYSSRNLWRSIWSSSSETKKPYVGSPLSQNRKCIWISADSVFHEFMNRSVDFPQPGSLVNVSHKCEAERRYCGPVRPIYISTPDLHSYYHLGWHLHNQAPVMEILNKINRLRFLSITKLWWEGSPNSSWDILLTRRHTKTRLRAAKIFKNCIELPQQTPQGGLPKQQTHNTRSITGITFDDRGDQLVTAAEDESFRLYSCKSGK